jgi:hypothetical protein
MTLAEIREVDADPTTATVYLDIKRATGLPQVNLIYRHLATVPGMLAWTWAVIGPLYKSGAIARHARALIKQLAIPADDGGILDSLPAAEREAVATVLAFYNYGNSNNLVAFSALLHASQSPPEASPADQGIEAAAAPAPLADIPALPRREALAPDVLNLIAELTARQGGAQIGVTPSLYLHLGLWPEALRLTHARVMAMIDNGALSREVGMLVSKADTIALSLQSRLGRPQGALPAGEHLATSLATVRTFVRNTIPEMVVIGHHLHGRGKPEGLEA